MSVIKINVSEVLNSGTYIVKAKRNISSVKQDISAIRRNVDSRIMNRNGIKGGFEHIIYELGSLERKLDRIKNFAENSANEYYRTEQRVKRFSDSILNRQTGSNKYSTDKSLILSQFLSAKDKKGRRNKINIFSLDSIVTSCIGKSKAIINKTKKICKRIKKSYDEKGKWYKAHQYGKAILSIGSAVIKIAASVAAISSGVGVPIAIVAIISAGNDFINAANNIAYTYTENYEEIDKHNALKDYLVQNGRYVGTEVLKNEDVGKGFGQLVYSGVEAVSFLDSADKMLKSFGKVNTVVTGTAKHSFVWGDSSWDDVIDNKIKFSFDKDYYIRKMLKINPSSNGNIIYETVKGAYKTKKKGDELVGNIIENIE